MPNWSIPSIYVSEYSPLVSLVWLYVLGTQYDPAWVYKVISQPHVPGEVVL